MRHSAFLTVLPLVMVAVCMTPAELRSATFEGDWRYTQLIEDEQSEPNCRWFHVTTRRYNLQRDSHGRYSGTYVRQYRITWLGPTSQCPDHIRPGTAARLYRSDLWYLAETEHSESRLKVLAELDSCIGACSNDFPTSRQWNGDLTLGDGVLIDDLGGNQGRYIFIPERSAQIAEQSAAERMFSLMEPMYEGECSRFFSTSLDPWGQENTPKAELCTVVRRLGKLMPPILYHKPLSATYFAYGRFRRMTDGAPLEVWGGRDVLVEQLFVVTPEGGNAPVSAVLRRQPDDTWKVLVPTP